MASLTGDFLQSGVVFLTAAVVAVPLAQRAGLGSVLGYLLAGVAIGPWGLGLISDVNAILHFAEFGVVLLLFLIGLELNPKKTVADARSDSGPGRRAGAGYGGSAGQCCSFTGACLAEQPGGRNGAGAFFDCDCAACD